METFSDSLRSLAFLLLACLAALAVFGLILALLWALPGLNSLQIKLALTIASAIVAFLAGGALSARLNPQAWLWQALVFGLLFGGVSFGYLFGLSLNALLPTGLAVLSAVFGGWLVVGRKARSALR